MPPLASSRLRIGFLSAAATTRKVVSSFTRPMFDPERGFDREDVMSSGGGVGSSSYMPVTMKMHIDPRWARRATRRAAWRAARRAPV